MIPFRTIQKRGIPSGTINCTLTAFIEATSFAPSRRCFDPSHMNKYTIEVNTKQESSQILPVRRFHICGGKMQCQISGFLDFEEQPMYNSPVTRRDEP